MGVGHEISNVKLKCSLSEGTITLQEGATPFGEMQVAFPADASLACFIGTPVYFVADGKGNPLTVGNFNQKDKLGTNKSSDNIVGIISQPPRYSQTKQCREAEVIFFGYFIDGLNENITLNNNLIQKAEFSTNPTGALLEKMKTEGLPGIKASSNSDLIYVYNDESNLTVGDPVMIFLPTTVTPKTSSSVKGGYEPDMATIGLTKDQKLELLLDNNDLGKVIENRINSHLTYNE